MAVGPGKYDDCCTTVRELTDGALVLVMVVGGDRGNGFSVQSRDEQLVARLPDLLRTMANNIEAA